MTKVVINKCYGGFGLSNEAFEQLLTRKGIEFESTPCTMTLKGKDNDYWRKGHVGENDAFLWHYNFTQDRSDADLVAVVEQFGDAASGGYADLHIVEIPDDVDWYVEEYDGNEWVAEKHRTWS